MNLGDIGQGQRSSHATHLMLVTISTKCGKNLSWTVDATGQTWKVNRQTDGRTDRQGESNIPPPTPHPPPHPPPPPPPPHPPHPHPPLTSLGGGVWGGGGGGGGCGGGGGGVYKNERMDPAIDESYGLGELSPVTSINMLLRFSVTVSFVWVQLNHDPSSGYSKSCQWYGDDFGRRLKYE